MVSFIRETGSLLSELEMFLKVLQNNPGDEEALLNVFRVFHTINSVGSMFGFDAMSAFAREVEEFLDPDRYKKRNVPKDLINLCQDAREQLERMLDMSLSANQNKGEQIKIIQAMRGIVK